MSEKKTLTSLPAVFSINKNREWYMETPDAIYQGIDQEQLFLILCDLIIDAIEEMDQDSKILSQVIIQ